MEYHIRKTGGVRKALKMLSDNKDWIPEMENDSGKPQTTRKEILQVATEFYRNLYFENQPSEDLNLDAEEDEIVPEFLHSEVELAIKTQKNGKAPGPDSITNEMIKMSITYNSSNLVKLTKLFNSILTTEYIPSQWSKSAIILIHKKGDRNSMDNYRPISLLSNIYKVFAKLVLNRITKTLDEQQPKEQAGFRAGYSTVDHIHVLKQLIEKTQEYGKPLYIAFVDYNKAFDSLKHDLLWKTLLCQGVPKKFIRIIRNVYTNSTAQIKTESLGEEFPISKGVRQGDPLSPKLFSAALEGIFRKLYWDDFGININGVKLNHLRFADDLVLISNNSLNLQIMLSQLAVKSREIGLTMNKSKTKIMTNREQVDIVVDKETIEYVTQYIYLGQTISFKDQIDLELERRVTCAWKRYWSLREIMKSKHFPIAAKKKVFNICILPCLTYGCQTWALSQKNLQKLRTCQRGMERSMLGYTRKDRKKAKDIRKTTKVEDILQTVKKLKWRWTGHMTRESSEKWTQKISDWIPRDGKRKRGKQYRRWEDDIKKVGGATWKRTARDRDKWKMLEEAYVSKGHADS